MATADLAEVGIALRVTGKRDVAAAERELDKAQRTLARLALQTRTGAITEKEFNNAVTQATSKVAKKNGLLINSNQIIRSYVKNLRNATDAELAMAAGVAKSGKGIRNLELLAQQAGYQVGDFAVQVQSGTNVAVAFGQQMSQLLGFIGPMGAVAGAGVAIGTGLIAPLLNARDTAKDVTERFEELEEALGSVAIAADASIEAGLTAKLVSAQSAVNELVARMQSEDFKKAMSFAGASTASGQVAQTIIDAELEGRKKLVNELTNQAGQAAILEAQERVRAALVGDQVQESQNLAAAKRIILDLEERNKIAAKKLEKLEQGRADAVAAQFNALMASIAANDRKNKQEDARRAKLNQQLDIEEKRLRDEIALLTMRKQFGDQSLAVRQLETDIAVENYKADLLRKGVAEETVNQLTDQYRLSLNLKRELQEMSNITFNFAPTSAVSRAMQKYAGRSTVSTKDPIFGETGKSIYTEPPKGAKKTTIEDTIQNLRRQMEVEQALMSLTGQRRREEEVFLQLKHANQDADIKTSETRLRSIAQEVAAMEERSRVIEEARKQQEDLAESIQGSMEDAFMSIVDGTESVKDAFRIMARDIIAELYRVFVVKQMVAGITGTFDLFSGPAAGSSESILGSVSAKGNVFSSGSLIKAFANGGVVGGPTYFPMAGGRMGLMGEAGPEAIMPLTRGPNGKLGVEASGGGSVVVNQSFNFSANGDDSVRRIIAEETPKIAELTSSAIIDQRRRGGSIRRAFK